MPNINIKIGDLRSANKISHNKELGRVVGEHLSEAKSQKAYSMIRQDVLAAGNTKKYTIEKTLKHIGKEEFLTNREKSLLKHDLFSMGANAAGKEKFSQGSRHETDHRNNYAEIMGKRISAQSLGGGHVKQGSAGQPAQRISFASSNAKMHQAEELIAKRPSHEETAHKVYVDKSEDQLKHTRDMIARITGNEN